MASCSLTCTWICWHSCSCCSMLTQPAFQEIICTGCLNLPKQPLDLSCWLSAHLKSWPSLWWRHSQLTSFGPAPGCLMLPGAADCMLPDACSPLPCELSHRRLWLSGVCQTPADFRAQRPALLTLAEG